MRHGKKIGRSLVIIFIVLLFVLAFVWAIFNLLDFSSPLASVEFGVTFSHKYAAEDLGLDWQQTYLAILDDLGVKNVRLVAPWDWVEKEKDVYDFSALDWMFEEADKRGVGVILAIGRRTPRWPECHDPSWLPSLSSLEQDQKLLALIERSVSHFKKYQSLKMWQVENEPFLSFFGECPAPNSELIAKEVKLVKLLDRRPVMVTDTGELSDWQTAGSFADVLGVTMYKIVWNDFTGLWRYPWPPAYYYFKAQNVKSHNPGIGQVIVSELQAEPWNINGENITHFKIKEQYHLFDLKDFQRNLTFVKKAGFPAAYLWGVEWWYWLKTEKDEPRFWNAAKAIWQK
ncbi:hypothetical protein GYA13_04400 [Candidatus Kuenenbacteria bacterium]|nr:hypothetical protein [Candidatus Kuenenbacteria bacterium]